MANLLLWKCDVLVSVLLWYCIDSSVNSVEIDWVVLVVVVVGIDVVDFSVVVVVDFSVVDDVVVVVDDGYSGTKGGAASATPVNVRSIVA